MQILNLSMHVTSSKSEAVYWRNIDSVHAIVIQVSLHSTWNGYGFFSRSWTVHLIPIPCSTFALIYLAYHIVHVASRLA